MFNAATYENPVGVSAEKAKNSIVVVVPAVCSHAMKVLSEDFEMLPVECEGVYSSHGLAVKLLQLFVSKQSLGQLSGSPWEATA